MRKYPIVSVATQMPAAPWLSCRAKPAASPAADAQVDTYSLPVGVSSYQSSSLLLCGPNPEFSTLIPMYRRIGWPPGFPYGDRCVFVANDWHASLVPVYLAGRYRRHGVYKVHLSVGSRVCV